MSSTSAPIGASENAHIYCHFCESIQPLVVDEPQRGGDSRFDCATDLVCAACQFVVATAYTPRSSERAQPGECCPQSATIRGPAIEPALQHA